MTGSMTGGAAIGALEDESLFDPNGLLDRLEAGENPTVINFLEIFARPLNEQIDIRSNPVAGGAIGAGPTDLDDPFIELAGAKPATSFFFADSEWCGRPHDFFRPNQEAIPRLLTGGDYTTRGPILPTDVRRSQTTVASSRLIDTDGFFGNLVKTHSLGGMRASHYVGEEGDTSDNHNLVVNLLIKNTERDGNEATFNFEAADSLLDRPAQKLKYTGAGGDNGDGQLKDVFKPLLYGYGWNVSPVVVERDLNIFETHGAGDIGGYDGVFDRRAPIAFDGRQFATYPEFRLAAINAPAAPGFYMLGPKSYFQVGNVAANSVITCDVRGSTLFGAYEARTRAIWRWILAGAFGSGGAFVNEGTFGVIPDDEIGLYLDGPEAFTFQELGDALLAPHLCWNDVDKFGRIDIARLSDPSGGAALDVFGEEDILDWRARELDAPILNFQEMTWDRNWTQMAPSDIIEPDSPQMDAETYRRLQRVEETGDGYGNSALNLRYDAATSGSRLRGYFRYQHHSRAAAQHIQEVFSKPLYELEIDVPFWRARHVRRGFRYAINHPEINQGEEDNMSVFAIDPTHSEKVVTLKGVFAGLA